ncbi:NAD-dependent histone deacetylase sir2 [Yamadazyma tenuis]|uniref:SIR2-domain-containing protein n=1 Tax=Candida tenuis (strain ATCC 10573 / BCRC 21748 / CBS 615 / JCM 9827 / NBRC 10315 / NRRL Y-1498 / VKM Y-70) TaxID=590646 RepID=G3B989_CANTC|nr:SIR2-domain-containing protein [Yamadazyma tenuis ATCC 10573]XP_006688851.1 uncharacterized protein CANTEDRAFT_115287 [Yamadazyma tenuis ATCC 10573]EGV62680.1 SIR2-domain-containing protein [Yamadazyma tenuis ATCC 10573]EGV62681.1 hypothetical protein CANTEDRAFT_115287 [Yamadazyma tenuis ATCC 10573]WEJ93067.1 NAD-dependent histone deacetylase sir2 [Yamadazyma tenuis]
MADPVQDIVLIESDQESEIDSNTRLNLYNKRVANDQLLNDGKRLATKPFASTSDSDATSSSIDKSAPPPVSPISSSADEPPPETSNLSDEHVNGGYDDSDALAQTSSSESSEDLSDEEDEILHSRQLTEEATDSQVFEARAFLKANGSMAFVRAYLPKTANIDDIRRAIGILGFNVNPGQFASPSFAGMINALRISIHKVLRQRSRLQTFYSIDHVLEKIKSSNRILVITGAGISTSLGIPDFRSSKGFYSQLGALGLSDPQEVFDLDFFRQDPSIFYSIAHMILPPTGAFTPLHEFIKLLESKNKLLRNYTQNIDNLEENVGLSHSKVVQCHGSFANATCMTCKYKVPLEAIRKDILKKTPSLCPRCEKKRKKLEESDSYFEESYGVFKPDITFFHEKLPERFHDLIKQDILECDLLISIGTSLEVAPVADIVKRLPGTVPQVLINKTPILHNEFDVSLLGCCDDVASFLCMKLGWELEHKDFNSILGSQGDNLEIRTLNEYRGLYSVTNLASQQAETDQES